jgi:methylmalonyl-CoA mutase
VIRSTPEEKEYQITMLAELHKSHADKQAEMIKQLQYAAIQNKNIFAELMDAVKYMSLGQITRALFEVGGQYRRNM